MLQFSRKEDLKPDFKYVITPAGGREPLIRSDGLRICLLKVFLEQEIA